LACLTACPTGLYAYEDDVHYGLTKWLATKGGFDEDEAETIALGDKNVDGGALKDPTKFRLLINLKTAKALGLTTPQSLLIRADQIVER
jgi:hypothetical protein